MLTTILATATTIAVFMVAGGIGVLTTRLVRYLCDLQSQNVIATVDRIKSSISKSKKK